MAEPAAGDRDVDASGDEVYGGRVPEAVWRHEFCYQRQRDCFGRPNIARQFEARI